MAINGLNYNYLVGQVLIMDSEKHDYLALLDIKQIDQTSEASPSEWNIEMLNADKYYVRYQWGSFEVLKVKEFNWNRTGSYCELIFQKQLYPKMIDGFLETEKMLELFAENILKISLMNQKHACVTLDISFDTVFKPFTQLMVCMDMEEEMKEQHNRLLNECFERLQSFHNYWNGRTLVHLQELHLLDENNNAIRKTESET